MDNSIINSVKRLERAGSEFSKTTEKLKEAAIETANYIVNQFRTIFPSMEEFEKYELVRGYCIVKLSNGVVLGYSADGMMFLLNEIISRDMALRFSVDIANGLLKEIAILLEDRTDENVMNEISKRGY